MDVRPGAHQSLPASTDASGTAEFEVPLGSGQVFIGDLYAQWFYLDPGAPRTLAMSATEGLQVRVRP